MKYEVVTYIEFMNGDVFTEQCVCPNHTTAYVMAKRIINEGICIERDNEELFYPITKIAKVRVRKMGDEK